MSEKTGDFFDSHCILMYVDLFIFDLTEIIKPAMIPWNGRMSLPSLSLAAPTNTRACLLNVVSWRPPQQSFILNQTVNDGVAHSKNPKKCANHVNFDLDLDFENTLDAGLPVDHHVQVWWRSGQLSARSDFCASTKVPVSRDLWSWPLILTLTLSTSWMNAYPETIVCKFGGDPANCLREEAICAKVYRQTDGQTTDAAPLH